MDVCVFLWGLCFDCFERLFAFCLARNFFFDFPGVNLCA